MRQEIESPDVWGNTRSFCVGPKHADATTLAEFSSFVILDKLVNDAYRDVELLTKYSVVLKWCNFVHFCFVPCFASAAEKGSHTAEILTI